MKIDFSNGSIIDSGTFTIHDDFFVSMSFEREWDTGIIKLHILKYDEPDKKHCIKFVNVLGYEGTSCSFWGHQNVFLVLNM